MVTKNCGTCKFYDKLCKACRCPFDYKIPKGVLPMGVKLDRVPMESSDGEGCTFWKNVP